MKKVSPFCLIFLIFLINFLCFENVATSQMVCYLDTTRITQDNYGLSKLDSALPFCNILIFGYAGINSKTFELENIDSGSNLDLYYAVNSLKRKHSHLRILLSVGGDQDEFDDMNGNNKYLTLLENTGHRNAFINSAQLFMATYGFDGLDLAWQFPKNPKKDYSTGIKRAWHKFLGWFKSSAIDKNSELHKEQFVTFLGELKRTMSSYGLMLTMTMLPHVNPELFIDIPRVMPLVDFITLSTFDFVTPDRDEKMADYTASLYQLYERDPAQSIDYQIQYWLNNTAETNKIIMGVPAYGLAWTIKESGVKGVPPLAAEGSAPPGNLTNNSGVLSWPEICIRMHDSEGLFGDNAPLRRMIDPISYSGSYCYRSANKAGQFGMWISFEEPETAVSKAEYARVKGLGGVALFDLTMDDAQGICGDGKYPILRIIKYILSKVQ